MCRKCEVQPHPCYYQPDYQTVFYLARGRLKYRRGSEWRFRQISPKPTGVSCSESSLPFFFVVFLFGYDFYVVETYAHIFLLKNHSIFLLNTKTCYTVFITDQCTFLYLSVHSIFVRAFNWNVKKNTLLFLQTCSSRVTLRLKILSICPPAIYLSHTNTNTHTLRVFFFKDQCVTFKEIYWHEMKNNMYVFG